jgi:alkanesulfonate monooxygenase SsuD/methylene tetrahydromethanopterin reductase-like flavin-dependent oxidoreductase (luciferase family)
MLADRGSRRNRDETWRSAPRNRRGVGGDPAAIREFAQAAEEIGYQDLSAPDHVLGVNIASRPDRGDRNTSADLFHDPFVLFAFLAGCTRTIEFSTQVLILAQRQAVLVAKQAAMGQNLRKLAKRIPARIPILAS